MTVTTFTAAEAVIEDAFCENQILSRNMLVLATTMTLTRRPRMRQMIIHQLQAMTPGERDVFMAEHPVPSDIVAALGTPVEIEPLPAPDMPEPTLAHYTAAIERHVDATARQRDYASGISCASYADSANPAWVAEAAAFISWRDAVWVHVFGQLAAVAGGDEDAPGIDNLLSALPEMVWPEAGHDLSRRVHK